MNDAGESIKGLRESFGHSQAVKFKPAPAAATTQESKETSQADVLSDKGHGLPAGVKVRGKGFASELLEASRRLGALVRYKELRGGVRGRFISSLAEDRIETEDIRNQRTVAHEIGHAIESLLFPRDTGTKYVSLGTKFGGSDKAFRKELTAVSELMRGPITGKPHHISYRRKGAELFADFISLYIHDPDMARKLAPDFTRKFESVSAGNKQVANVLKELHAENVIPMAAEHAATPTGTASAMPGKMPARPPTAVTMQDREIAGAAQDIVAGAVRMREAETQAALVKQDNWQKAVPKVQDRNDIGAFIEGIGNLEKPGDTIADVQARMTPAKQSVAKQIRFATELTRQEVNKTLRGYGENQYLKFLEDYMGHFYVGSQKAVQGALRGWVKNSPNAKERKLPTLKEAVEMGLKPITQDPTETYVIHSSMNWRVAAAKKVLYETRRLKGKDGEPAILPKDDAPPDWPVLNHPLIQQVYAHPTAKGMMLWKSGAAIHPDVYPALRQILETPTSSKAGKIYDSINAFSRLGVFAGSLFHDFTLRLASTGAMMQPKNPLRGLVLLGERDPVTGENKLIQSTRKAGTKALQDEDTVRSAVADGLKLSDRTSDQYEVGSQKAVDQVMARLKATPGIGKFTDKLNMLYNWRQHGLWRNTHDAYKIIAYLDLKRRGVDGKVAASFLNDAFGGQERQLMFWADPRTQKILGRVLLAPDWTLSTLRSLPGLSDVASFLRSKVNRGAAPRYEGFKGNSLRFKFWTAEMAALVVAGVSAQYLIYKAFGDKDKGDHEFPWENEAGEKTSLDITPLMRHLPWHNPNDPTRYYVNPGKRASEVFRWFYDPIANATSKLAQPMQEGIKQVSGVSPISYKGVYPAEWVKDNKASWASIPDRAISAGKIFAPFALRTPQFGLSLPMHHGTTATEETYRLLNDWADKSDDPAIKERLGTKTYFAGNEPVYRGLKTALFKNDDKAAQAAYEKVRQTHSWADIEKALNPHHPFAGSLANERAFTDSLTEQQMEVYDKAVAERERIWDNYLDLDRK
jgi:hypothetical protein